MSERDAAALVGTVLQDSYRLTRLIGAGGMGAVYEALQLRLNKRVAVKLMVRDLAANEEALARFRREAEVTSHLGHPHIVNVFDFGTSASGASYLVMEYLEGEDLDHRLRRAGQQSLSSTIHVVKQVASALAATHAKGVVHRDLKPANLFILDVEGETDFVKVVDFGISKVRAATTKLTGASAVMGTPNYMSPEQAKGQIEDIDHRTDQWSLACIAYEMLAGRGPFVGESAASLLYQVIHEEPPPLAAKVPDLPPAVEKVINRGLSKDMKGRYSNITAFSRALEQAGSGKPHEIEAAPRRPKVLSKVGGGTEDQLVEKSARPTTFSNTASEMLPPTASLSRLRNRRIIIATGAMAALLTVVLVSRSRSGPAKPAAATRASSEAQSGPAPPRNIEIAPTTAPPAAAIAPVAPTPVQHASGEGQPAPKGTAAQPMPVRSKRVSEGTHHATLADDPNGTSQASGARLSNDRAKLGAPRSAPSLAGNPKAKWVDPFDQVDAPAKASATDQNAKRPPKARRRLIEDL